MAPGFMTRLASWSLFFCRIDNFGQYTLPERVHEYMNEQGRKRYSCLRQYLDGLKMLQIICYSAQATYISENSVKRTEITHYVIPA